MSWARWLVDHAVTVAIGVLTILTFGVAAYITLPREAAPDITIPVVLVQTMYFGVSPEDIESLVTVPMERELSSLKDVDTMTSNSAEGVSLVVLEFDPDTNIDDALQKVREKVDTAESKIPEDAEDTVVNEISFSDFPILIVSMTGPYDEEVLKELAEDLQDEIENVAGVLDVSLSGGLDREIKVYANPDRMARYEVSFDDIMRGIQMENVNIPGGQVNARDSDYLLRVPGEFKTVADIESVPIKNVGGRTVFVSDVARVVDGYADRATYSRMNGTPSLSLSVTKRVGENIVEIAEGVHATVASQSEAWPEGVEYSILADQSREIAAMVGELENNIITGLLLVVVVLLFFMGFRNSLFVGLAIPLSMFMSFMILDALGLTLNMVVLFSLILALGMLVDNAIVIVENIYRHVEEGKDLKDASVVGVSEVAVPVATSTLTTVLAFAPMLFWSGIMGQFMGYLPKTLIIVLVSSLFVALVVIPTATSVLMKKAKTTRSGDEIPQDGLLGASLRRYRKVLELSIDHRYISLGVGGLSLIGTFFIYGAFNHGTEFFPETEPNRAIINIETPDGTRIETTDGYARQIEAILIGETDIDTFVTEVGVGGGDGGMQASSTAPNRAMITIDFKPGADRAREGEEVRTGNTFKVIDRIRESSEQAVGATIKVDKVSEGPPVGLPISVEISGDDFHELGRLSEQLQRKIATIDGVVDLSDNYKVGRPELSFQVDRAATKNIGASTMMVANTIRTAVSGTKASVLRVGDEEYDIMVSLEPEFTADIQSILDMRVPGRDNFMVPLSSLVSYDTLGGSGAIPHMDRDKTVTVTGDVGEGFRVDLVQAAVTELIESSELPEGYSMRMGGANEEEVEAAAFLMRAFLIAVCMIFLVLVTQFDSVTRPFIIMASVVLSLIGVLWGLLLTGTPFGIMMTGVGVISLAGVVVNNAIVMLDYVQQMRDAGHDVREALIRAGLVRFRPVILTAITTILGLIPMATGISFDFRKMELILGGGSAQFWGPMAVAVCFGLAVATVLTLVMVPTMYSINEDISGGLARLFKRSPSPRATQVVAQATKILLAGLLIWGVSGVARAETVTLDQALEAAEDNNLDLQLSAENAYQAQTQVGQAWSALSPKLILGAGWTYWDQAVEIDTADFSAGFDTGGLEDFITWQTEFDEWAATGLYTVAGANGIPLDDPPAFPEQEDEEPTEAEPIVFQQRSYGDASLTVSQPLFNATALFGLRGAYDNRDMVEANHAWTRMQIRSAVTRSYYGVAVARAAQGMSLDALENAQRHLEQAQLQVNAGAAAEIVQLQAELAVSRAKRAVADADNQVTVAQQAFAKLTGLPASSGVSLPNPPPMPTDSLGDALEAAVAQRPDLMGMGAQVEAAQMRLRYDQLGWLPTVDGNFTALYTGNVSDFGNNDTTRWFVGLNANWTLWDGGYRLNTNKMYGSQLRQAELMELKAVQDAEEQVHAAWQAYQRATVAYDAVSHEVALAEESLRLAETSFSAGTGTFFDVSDAQLMLDQARIGELSERMNRDLAVVDLAVAMGGFE